MPRILVVDDEATIAWGLARLAREEGHEALTAASAEEALEILAETPCDLVFLDVRLPGVDGLTAMPDLARAAPAPRIIVMTAFGDLQTAVRAYGNGAFEYLVKPFDLDDAAQLMRRALAPAKRPAAGDTASPDESEVLIGKSSAMQGLFKRIALVAPTESTVVITGESGTGKELVARAIHQNSLRAPGPLVPIHVAALSPALVERELFGEQRGGSARPGVLANAQGGTAFFDEIGELPLEIQAKLLRVIEQQEIVPVGATQPQPVHCRILAATNRDLRREMREGRFREDLYFRLAMFELALPPLRARLGDVPLLAEAFLAAAPGKDLRFAPEVVQVLCDYPWPGNVRQLRNAVHHAALMARSGEIELQHLPVEVQAGEALPTHLPTSADDLSTAVRDWTRRRLRSPGAPVNLYEQFLHAVEPPLLEVVLERTGHNRAAAAELLGIHRATLRKKLSEAN